MSQLIEQLKRHEGLRLKPYHCTAGKLTIGYGRNLDDTGISEAEAELLLEADIAKVQKLLQYHLEWYVNMNAPRQAVFANMVFNLGIGGFFKFKRMRIAAMQGDYATAAVEMLDSLWARQVGQRADELAEQMRTGEWQ